MLNKRTNYHKR